MCGLAGILNVDASPVSQAILGKMGEQIAHRGPDGEGIFVDGAVGLAHRRLAVIDLSSSAHQPMLSQSGRFALAYNGEVYNYQGLRLELEALGHGFRSRSDTEVVLNALVEWGEEALSRFNGMFALALWDREEKSLLLARDRYGTKPLYYAQENQTFLFGSEIKAITSHPKRPSRLDPEGLAEYLTFQNFFSSRTLFEGVRMLPPGHRLKVDNEGELTFRQFWDFRFEEPENPASEGECEEQLKRLFSQAVNRQLVADVPVSAYLSGGMDSGSIVGVASRQLDRMKTFTVGFDMHSISGVEIAYDEREWAEHMSYRFKTEHYEMVLKAGDMEYALPHLAHHLEEPRIGQSYPNFYAAQLASKFGKVVLSGAGGDELFGGYPWRYYRAASCENFDEFVDHYYGFWQRLIPEAAFSALLAPLGRAAEIDSKGIFRDVLKGISSKPKTPQDFINCSLYLEAKTFLHGILVLDDKLSMAHGLEARVPFLDNDLVDFAMTLPVAMKLEGAGSSERLNENEFAKKKRTNQGKYLLRKAMSSYVPERIVSREKQGFSAPDASWFKGDSIDYLQRRIFNKRARLYDVLDEATVHSLVNEHLSGKENRRLLIWSLLYLESWLEEFA